MFDKSWEDIHAGRMWGTYPNEELVRFVARNYYAAKPRFRNQVSFVDLGCGAGASTLYLIAEGFQVMGVDASKSAITSLFANAIWRGKNLERLSTVNVDVTEMLWPDQCDCVLDVACLQHISEREHIEVVRKAHAALKPGGKMFAVMATNGTYIEMVHPGTRLTSQRDVRTIYTPFSKVEIGTVTRHPFGKGVIQEWIVEATK